MLENVNRSEFAAERDLRGHVVAGHSMTLTCPNTALVAAPTATASARHVTGYCSPECIPPHVLHLLPRPKYLEPFIAEWNDGAGFVVCGRPFGVFVRKPVEPQTTKPDPMNRPPARAEPSIKPALAVGGQ